MYDTANKIKEMRSRKGYSQEELAERSGLSLRTIQRIENGETEPRGDSLTRLASAFDVTVDDLADWGLVDDNHSIMAVNLSALSFLLNPMLGILVPLIIWLFKKNKIRGLNDAARSLLNFQITWIIILSLGIIVSSFTLASGLRSIVMFETVSPTLVAGSIKRMLMGNFSFGVLMYVFNLIMILVNARRASQGKKMAYWPALPFIKK